MCLLFPILARETQGAMNCRNSSSSYGIKITFRKPIFLLSVIFVYSLYFAPSLS